MINRRDGVVMPVITRGSIFSQLRLLMVAVSSVGVVNFLALVLRAWTRRLPVRDKQMNDNDVVIRASHLANSVLLGLLGT